MSISQKSARKRHFTLIELMVVVIIVAVLAAVAVPLYSSQVNRAKASEAVAGLGAIRSAQRVYKAEHGTYVAVTAANIGNAPTAALNPGLGLDFSSNKYFDNAAFAVGAADATTFTATCTGDNSGATSAADVAGYVISMTEDGTVTQAY
jgi:prepilin-type N-terminal cleavage/methylation domain-containing protein